MLPWLKMLLVGNIKSYRDANSSSGVHMRIMIHVFGSWDDVSTNRAFELDGRCAFKRLPALEDVPIGLLWSGLNIPAMLQTCNSAA